MNPEILSQSTWIKSDDTFSMQSSQRFQLLLDELKSQTVMQDLIDDLDEEIAIQELTKDLQIKQETVITKLNS